MLRPLRRTYVPLLDKYTRNFFPRIDWKILTCKNPNESDFIMLINDSGFNQLVEQGSHQYGNTQDLIMSCADDPAFRNFTIFLCLQSTLSTYVHMKIDLNAVSLSFSLIAC